MRTSLSPRPGLGDPADIAPRVHLSMMPNSARWPSRFPRVARSTLLVVARVGSGVVVQVTESTPPAARSKLRRPRLMVAIAICLQLVVLVVVIGLAGGFRAAPAEPLPRAQIGEPVENGRFEIRVLRAWTEDKDPMANPDYADAGKFLVVELDMRLTVNESLRFGADVERCLRLRFSNGYVIDGDGSKSLEQRLGAVLARDRSPVSLHPGLPERVLAVYELPASQPFPSQLDVVIYRMEFREGFFDQSRIWRAPLDDYEAALIHLPVTRGAG
jgi:hypothetical protein